MILLIHEVKRNMKSLLIWAFCVGVACFGCLILFEGIEDTIEPMAEMYGELGAFSAALGLDKINIATLEGYYATEVALVFSLGGAMFAAMTGAVMLSKEEEGHTAEFLNTLPLGRNYIAFWKYAAVILLILLFHCICMLWVCLGFAGAGGTPSKRELLVFHGAMLLSHLEIGSICYLFSAINRKKQIGAALGFSVLLYIMDLVCRVVPDIENLKYITPYYFANAADIFTCGSVDGVMAGISIGITVLSALLAVVLYRKRNLYA